MSYWVRKSGCGLKQCFESPDELWSRACDYFEWNDANPFQKEQLFCHQGVVVTGTISVPRVLTMRGLCLHLGIHHSSWQNYRVREGYDKVVEHIENIIYTQKFELAAANFINANFIGKELGLVDKQEVDHRSSDGTAGKITVCFKDKPE